MKLFLTVLTTIFCLNLASGVAISKDFNNTIVFYGFNSAGVQFSETLNQSTTSNGALLQNCNPQENYTIVVHGWNETISAIWPMSLIQQFKDVRHGCVFFMDYSYYSLLPYLTLNKYFDDIWIVLTYKLKQLENAGFDPSNAHLFGFSFGSHVVLEGAYQYGANKINRVDACDPAGPAFGSRDPSILHAKESGKCVQCIHTSTDKGTDFRFCQKDVNMGECGKIQVGATDPPLKSHGLCPIFYRNSFTYDFPLVTKEVVESTYDVKCKNKTVVPNISNYPTTQMGFRMDMTLPDGEYYSLTGVNAPFNTM